MKKRLTALALALCLGLTGCASMLERTYEVSVPHVDRPVAAEEDVYIRVESYRELVNALLQLVEERATEGVIRLYDYTGDVETDLSAACMEVATEDPLGAYAVEYIKHEHTRVISYYQAAISIRYRRSQAQMSSMADIGGMAELRDRLQTAMANFEDEVVVRASDFAGDEQSVRELVRQVYYSDPASALGYPRVNVALYPAAGSQRVVELLFTWAAPSWELRQRQRALSAKAEEFFDALLEGFPDGEEGPEGPVLAGRIAQALLEAAPYDPQGGSTPYDALVNGAANDQGLALAYQFLCQSHGLSCTLVQGTLGGQERSWNTLEPDDGEVLCLDLAAGAALYPAEEFALLGYQG